MLYGLLTYAEGSRTYNLGDHVQSLAAKQYLPRVDVLLNRERLGEYDGPPVKVIMNGWFTHRPDTWVPSPSIIPHFVSFHVNSSAADRMLSPAGVDYLRRHAPIGCRDHHTVKLLRARGIEAFFTGCLTLTLDCYANPAPPRREAILVDPFFNLPSPIHLLGSPRHVLRGLLKGDWLRLGRRRALLNRAFTSSRIRSFARFTQELPSKGESDALKFDRAEAMLRRFAEASYVVYSRIHCALPCLAMGVPVIFLNAFDNVVDTCRFEGLLDLFNRIDYLEDGSAISNFGLRLPAEDWPIPRSNPRRHEPLAAVLRDSCRQFIG
jgi:hypothetical protein